MTLDVIVAAILSLQPALPTELVVKHSRVILEATSDEGDAAALVVTAHRETGFKTGCVVGIGGWGTYGLGYGYRHWSCGPLKIQAVMSLQALYDKGFPWNPRGAFKGYVGAKRNDWPEIQVRLTLWSITRERILCACSI